MEIVAVVGSGLVALAVALLGYLQWKRTEDRQAATEAANLRLAEIERTRALRVVYQQERLQALRELTQMLKAMELASRWHVGGHDMRSEEPRLNAFLITHRAVLTDEEKELALQFFEGLTWIDREVERDRLNWERERQSGLESGGIDIGSYESSWGTTREQSGLADAWSFERRWRSASAALDARLRDALQGM
ncbi:hypothetical protein ACIGZJ_17505 [Kitasatospora sp. NPDC052868]|uniref:hypothetical protein n=1 Tax=Kitasatospora sp. NPDC052868 TaxID=3364060 RepID=UPI0037C51CB3